MLHGTKLKTALSKVKLIAVHGPWSRVVGIHHMMKPSGGRKSLPQPLWGGAAKINGARFTPVGGFDSVYLAWEPITALLEVQALVLMPGGNVPLRTAPWALVMVDGVVSRVLDLTDASTLRTLGSNDQEMTGAWVKMKNPPTQELARAAHSSGKIAAIKYGSAKHPGGVNLVVFPDRLVAPSTDYLEVYDPYGSLPQRVGG
jgi:RES domain-containing protein